MSKYTPLGLKNYAMTGIYLVLGLFVSLSVRPGESPLVEALGISVASVLLYMLLGLILTIAFANSIIGYGLLHAILGRNPDRYREPFVRPSIAVFKGSLYTLVSIIILYGVLIGTAVFTLAIHF